VYDDGVGGIEEDGENAGTEFWGRGAGGGGVFDWLEVDVEYVCCCGAEAPWSKARWSMEMSAISEKLVMRELKELVFGG
jgi:hypothetical protein